MRNSKENVTSSELDEESAHYEDLMNVSKSDFFFSRGMGI
jgi:hypothetical protein